MGDVIRFPVERTKVVSGATSRPASDCTILILPVVRIERLSQVAPRATRRAAGPRTAQLPPARR